MHECATGLLKALAWVLLALLLLGVYAWSPLAAYSMGAACWGLALLMRRLRR